MFNHQLDTCKTDLENIITKKYLKECQNFINTKREARHSKTMDRQKQKLEQLCHRNSSERGGHSNTHGNHTCKQQIMQGFLHLTTIPTPKNGLLTSLANP